MTQATRAQILILGAVNAMTVLEFAIEKGYFKPTWDTLAFTDRFYSAMGSPGTMKGLLEDDEIPDELKQMMEMIISAAIFHGFRALNSLVPHVHADKVPAKVISAGIYVASLDSVATEVDVFKAHGTVLDDMIVERLRAIQKAMKSPNKSKESVEAALAPLFRRKVSV